MSSSAVSSIQEAASVAAPAVQSRTYGEYFHSFVKPWNTHTIKWESVSSPNLGQNIISRGISYSYASVAGLVASTVANTFRLLANLPIYAVNTTFFIARVVLNLVGLRGAQAPVVVEDTSNDAAIAEAMNEGVAEQNADVEGLDDIEEADDASSSTLSIVADLQQQIDDLQDTVTTLGGRVAILWAAHQHKPEVDLTTVGGIRIAANEVVRALRQPLIEEIDDIAEQIVEQIMQPSDEQQHVDAPESLNPFVGVSADASEEAAASAEQQQPQDIGADEAVEVDQSQQVAVDVLVQGNAR